MKPIMVDISMVLSAFAVGSAIFFGIKNHQRNKKHDDRSEGMQHTVLVVKLEELSAKMSEMKAEFKDQFISVKEDHDAIIAMQRDLKNIWGVINELKSQYGAQ